MIPEGLVLLTSLAFAVATVTLARQRVLVQELPAVEGLARVDIVLLDKTGTITEGVMRFDTLEAIHPEDLVTKALAALAADDTRNQTMQALCEAFPTPPGWERTASTPFSSSRKWSAATFGEHGTWVFGAPEMVWVGRPERRPGSYPLRRAGGRRPPGAPARTGRQRRSSARSCRGVSTPPRSCCSRSGFVTTRPRRIRYFHEQGVACKVDLR